MSLKDKYFMLDMQSRISQEIKNYANNLGIRFNLDVADTHEIEEELEQLVNSCLNLYELGMEDE